MRQTIRIIVTGLLFAPMFAMASEADDVMAPINRFIERAYAGDSAAAAKTFTRTSDTAIVDAFPPYLWLGPNAVGKWLASLEEVSKAHGLTEGRVTLGNPIRTEVQANVAYVLVPAEFHCKVNGGAFDEPGVISYVLKQHQGRWLIHSWTWAGPVPPPAAKN